MKKELAVGTVFLLAMLMLVVFTVVISGWSFTGTPQTLKIRFTNIEGLKVGDEVQVSGAAHGKVRKITLEDGYISVEAELIDEIVLHEDCKIRIRSASPLGGRMVSIEPGDPDKPAIAAGKILEGTHVGADIIDSIHELVMQIKEGDGTIAMLINDREVYDNLVDFTASLKTVTANLEKGQGLAGKLLSKESEETFAKADEAIGGLRDIIAGVNDGKGTIGKLVTDDSLYTAANDTFTNTRKITKDITEGPLGKFLTNQKLYDDVNVAFANVREMTEELKKGKSTAGRLIYDEEMGNDLGEAIASIRDIAAKAASGEGTIGKLLADASLFNDAKSMIENLSDLAKGLSDGKGTLGKLLTDDSLYTKAENLVTQMRQAAEDAREQAPVTAFGNVLLGGFR